MECVRTANKEVCISSPLRHNFCQNWYTCCNLFSFPIAGCFKHTHCSLTMKKTIQCFTAVFTEKGIKIPFTLFLGTSKERNVPPPLSIHHLFAAVPIASHKEPRMLSASSCDTASPDHHVHFRQDLGSRVGIDQKKLSPQNSDKKNVRLTAKECGAKLFFTGYITNGLS